MIDDRPVDLDRGWGAGDRDGDVAIGPDGQPAERYLDGDRPRCVADQPVRPGVCRPIGRPGPADPVGGVPTASGVLQQRQRSRTQHDQRHDAPATDSNRTQRPGRIAAAGSAFSSHSVTPVAPINCQPPGDSRG